MWLKMFWIWPRRKSMATMTAMAMIVLWGGSLTVLP